MADFTRDTTTGSTGSTGPTAGYNNNVEKNYGEMGEKKGFMSKVKDKLMPNGPGETDTSGIATKDAANHLHEVNEVHGGQGARHEQANADLNRE